MGIGIRNGRGVDLTQNTQAIIHRGAQIPLGARAFGFILLPIGEGSDVHGRNRHLDNFTRRTKVL